MATDFSRFDYHLVDEATDPDTQIDLLAFNEQQPTTRLLPLNPTKIDTGSPIERRPESGDVFGQNDFRGGMGQKLLHSASRREDAYYYSHGLDITKEGRVSLAHPLENLVVGTEFFALGVNEDVLVGVEDDATTTCVTYADLTGGLSQEDPQAGETPAAPVSFVVAGTTEYISLGANGIHRSVGGAAYAHYVDIDDETHEIAYLKNRLLAEGVDTTTDVHTLYEVTSVPAAVAIQALPVGWSFSRHGFAELGPFIYGAVRTTEEKRLIYHYGLNSAGTAIELKGRTEMPQGDIPLVLVPIFGQLFIGARRIVNDSEDSYPVCYMGVPTATGELQLILIAEARNAVTPTDPEAVRGAAVIGNRVVMGWKEDRTVAAAWNGTAIYDPAREAFRLGTQESDGPVTSFQIYDVASFKGHQVFATELGIYAEDKTQYLHEGVLITSSADWLNAGNKVWDYIELTFAPLPADTVIRTEYTTGDPEDSGTSWTQVGNETTDGATSARYSLSGVTGRRLTLRISLFSEGTRVNTPTLLNYSVRSYPKPEANEFILERFINLGKRGRRSPTSKAMSQKPRTLRKQLMSYANSGRLLFKEPDGTWSVRITGIEDMEPANPEQVDTKATKQEEFYVLKLTMEGTLVS